VAWTHPDHPGRRVRLGYCTNVLPVETLADLRSALTEVALPLRQRLHPAGTLGIGLHLPGSLAAHLASPEGASDLSDLGRWLSESGFDPFTYNAFPFGGFHEDGLKENVYRPTWCEPEREQYTLDVAQVACALVAACRGSESAADSAADGLPGHLSISTHPGTYGPWVTDRSELKACADAMARVVSRFSQREDGPPVILSLEAEPFASAGNTRALAEFLVLANMSAVRELKGLGHDASQAAALAARHLGVCLDACHSAVEFEDPAETWSLSSGGGLAEEGADSVDGGALPPAPRLGYTLGKIQFSSALALRSPAADPEGRALLLGMDEPRYLHQVRAQSAAGPLAESDLPALSATLAAEGPAAAAWLEAPEWRCHFHVPVDLESFGSLSTTRPHADALLAQALVAPGAWPTGELHVEVETYTWSVLPASGRPAGSLVDCLERELRHVEALLRGAGWLPS
jgi:hypothetical protein